MSINFQMEALFSAPPPTGECIIPSKFGDFIVPECYDFDFSGLLTLSSHALFMWVTRVR